LFEPIWRPEALAVADTQYGQHWIVVCDGVGARPVESASAVVRAALPDARVLGGPADGLGLDDQFSRLSIVVLELIQEILCEKPSSDVLIQVVVPAAGAGAALAGVSGLLKTAHLENPKVVGQVVAIGLHESIDELAPKLRDESRARHAHRVRYRAGE